MTTDRFFGDYDIESWLFSSTIDHPFIYVRSQVSYQSNAEKIFVLKVDDRRPILRTEAMVFSLYHAVPPFTTLLAQDQTWIQCIKRHMTGNFQVINGKIVNTKEEEGKQSNGTSPTA